MRVKAFFNENIKTHFVKVPTTYCYILFNNYLLYFIILILSSFKYNLIAQIVSVDIKLSNFAQISSVAVSFSFHLLNNNNIASVADNFLAHLININDGKLK